MTATLSHIERPPIVLRFRPGIDLSDEQFLALSAQNGDLRFERTAEGDIVVMSPADTEIDFRNAVVSGRLTAWALEDGTGIPFGPTAGFKLPNGAIRSPDAAWVSRTRKATIRGKRRPYWPICPDFVVEIRSPSDRLKDVMDKMREYLDNGALLGWLIDPIERKVYLYRPDRKVEVSDAPPTLAADPVPSGFVLELREVWDPPIDDGGGDDREDDGGPQS